MAGHAGIDLVPLPVAALGADVVVNAVAGQASLDALAAVGSEGLAGVVLLDVANPLDFSHGFPPTLSIVNTDSLGERIQAAFPSAHVVKALNTMNVDVMVDPASVGDAQHSAFVAGDDAEAKTLVTGLLAELGHRDVLDLGDITAARGMEMYLALWVRLLGAVGTASFNIRVVR